MRKYCRETLNKARRNIKSRFGTLKRMARARKLSCDLTFLQYTFLISTECFYCNKHTLGKEMGGGLDRINNKEGYTMNNVLPCCGDCNKARGRFWSVEEFQLIIKTISAFRRNNERST